MAAYNPSNLIARERGYKRLTGCREFLGNLGDKDMKIITYTERVLQLEDEGLTTSDAQIVADVEVLKAHANADLVADLLEALKIWMQFFDDMPKGQFGKISCDIGLMNDGFIKSRLAITKAEAS